MDAREIVMNQIKTLTESEQKKLEVLREYLKNLHRVCIAYSGGVDSTLVAAIAKEQLGNQAIAVTGVSDSLAPHLLNEAREQAAWIGIRHQECLTQELKDPAYSDNPVNRCFACKKELHKHLKGISQVAKGCQVVDGVNLDDLNEFRPGIQAARKAGVVSPLAELEIEKVTVRKISKALGLPWWNKPAQPCLASRFPYGEKIDASKLKQVAMGEAFIKSLGFQESRVRSFNSTAKIELPKRQIQEIFIDKNHEKIVNYFLSIGFTEVSIDLEGLVSGKLNRNLL